MPTPDRHQTETEQLIGKWRHEQEQLRLKLLTGDATHAEVQRWQNLNYSLAKLEQIHRESWKHIANREALLKSIKQ